MNIKLRDLQQRMKLPKSAAPAVPTPVADDLAEVLQRYVEQAVQAALGNAPPAPQPASRLAALERQLRLVDRGVPIGSEPGPAVNYRELFAVPDLPDHLPGEPPPPLISSYPAAPARPGDPFMAGPVDVRIIDRDLNNHIRTAIADTPRGQVQVEVTARDPNGHIAQVRLNRHLMNTSIDGMRGTMTFEPVAE